MSLWSVLPPRTAENKSENVEIANGSERIARLYGDPRYPEVQERALLMATAPELRDALSEAMAPYLEFRNDETNPPWVAKAREALAKARGT